MDDDRLDEPLARKVSHGEARFGEKMIVAIKKAV